MLARSIHADHKDLIHDIAYDYYGRRLATCSSDQSVKVWDLSKKGEWECTASWKTHSGSVWKVTWAHPEFGQLLATCSFDRTAIVWEEMITDNNNGERNQSVWVKRHSFVDSRTSVTDVKFAPKLAGLILATCSSDGIVRIYEAPDVMNVSQWTVQYEIVCNKACSSISWNPSFIRSRAPMLAVGCDDSNYATSKVLVFEHNENARNWVKLENMCAINDAVHDIAFAPNVGRSYDLLGVATTKDVKIISIAPLQQEVTQIGSGIQQATIQFDRNRFEILIKASFDDHSAQVWRVSWNITGTILASSGDDGTVRLWKSNYLESWKNVGVLKGDGHSLSPVQAMHSGLNDSSNALNNPQIKYFKMSNGS